MFAYFTASLTLGLIGWVNLEPRNIGVLGVNRQNFRPQNNSRFLFLGGLILSCFI